MSRRPARFTEADLNRARKIAYRADPPMVVEILVDGRIRLVPQERKPVGDSEDTGEDRPGVML